MAGQIKAGDVVRLKSGGPDMTVEKVEGTSAVCDWFDASGNPQRRHFAVASLEFPQKLSFAEPDD